jgi:DNA-binding transcriptional ArsR family regulator
MTPDFDLDEITELLRVLGHGSRLALLLSVADEELSVSEIEGRTGIKQPALSQQLGILRKAGLIVGRRDAKQVFYSIDNARFAKLSDLINILSKPDAKLLAVDGGDRFHSAGSAAAFAKIG